ncbi:MAG: hypothetical protein EXQ94_10430 [Alphaproteobacteria bacterium]|nr:hypothetical protein [Alphaproteobacteria bacterium]
MRIVIDAAFGRVVLNADDPECLRLAAEIRDRGLVLFTAHPEQDAVREHARRGAWIVSAALGTSGRSLEFRIGDGPATVVGDIGVHDGSALAVAAIALALGKSVADVGLGLATLGGAFASALGGFRVVRARGTPVILEQVAHADQSVDLCRLAAALGQGAPCAAILCGAKAAPWREHLAALEAFPGDRVLSVADARTAIAEAMALVDGTPGSILIVTENVEQAGRYLRQEAREPIDGWP